MFGVSDNNTIQVEEKRLKRLLTDNPETRERLQKVIGDLLWEARGRLSADIRRRLSGEHETWRAVRNIVYRKILGGNLNILNKRRGTANWRVVQKQRIVNANPGQRGGNRRQRTLTTARREGYEGSARGFILRFLNQGTDDRVILFQSDSHRERVNRGSQGGDVSKYGRTINTGNRGRITPLRFFEGDATKELDIMATELGRVIDDTITALYNNNE